MKNDKPILVAGATGYVGGRLIPALLDARYRVRAMGRSVEKLACRPWGHHPKVERVKGDVLPDVLTYRDLLDIYAQRVRRNHLLVYLLSFS